MQLMDTWQAVRVRQRPLIYVLGSVLVTVWTLLRFFTQRTIFDLVSQQVILHQWLHGAISPAHMGQTAYLPKMLVSLPAELLPGSPRLKLLLLTVVINIATFILLGLVLERLLHLYRVRIGGMFYAALLLLASIAGSVFWIQFANSRNLEVAGGVFWVYLGLRLLLQPDWRLMTGMAALGGLLFFDDPLQLYMSALPLLLYAFVLTAARKQPVRSNGKLLAVTIASWALAKVLFVLAGHWLQVSFTDTGDVHTPPLSLNWLVQSGTGTAQALISLFAGAADAGKLREVCNLGLLALGAGGLVYTFMRRSVSKRLALLLVCMTVTDIAVYVVSGQAVQGAATDRYLIMLTPMAIMALSTVRIPAGLRRYTAVVVAAVVCVNIGTLGMALGRHWSTLFPADVHLASTSRYIRRHPGLHIYASTDTAMPLQYLQNVSAATSLPVGCLAGKLVRTHFSMDQAFDHNADTPHATAAIVFDGDIIANHPNACTPQTVIGQLGPPLQTERTDDGSTVLLYLQSTMQLAR